MTRILGHDQRRGAVVAMTAISLLMLLGFATLAIDIGQAYSTKAALQNAADAAALAGISAMISDDALLPNFDPESDIINRVHSYAAQNSQLHSVQNDSSQLNVCNDGITIGHIDDPADSSEAIDATDPDTNAVAVRIVFDGECNPKLQTIFASLLGVDAMELNVSATAYYDDRFAGFAPGASGGALTPFSMSAQEYAAQLANPVDGWTTNPATGEPMAGSDGIPELWIYPDKQSGGGGSSSGSGSSGSGSSSGSAGSGNFGTLNIGISNNGTIEMGQQILNGVTDAQMTAEIGTDRVVFIDENGTYTYNIDGNPGLSAGLKSYVEPRVGDVLGFFIHSQVTQSGSNALFTITGMRFGRLMEINLSNNPNQKRIVLQPTVYNGAGIIFDPAAPSSGGLVARLQLIR
jgi:Flp pilus assembly protein TadG